MYSETNKVKYWSELTAKHGKDLASFPLHARCSISEVVQKTQCQKPAMRNVTHWCLFWLHFPSPSREEMFSGSQKRQKEARVKSRLLFPSPCCTLLTWKTGSHMGIELLSSYLLPSGGSKLKRKIVSRCTHLLCPFFICLQHYYIYTHLHTVAKGAPVLCNPTFFYSPSLRNSEVNSWVKKNHTVLHHHIFF